MLQFRKEKKPREHVATINENLQLISSASKNEKDKRKALELVSSSLNSLKESLIDKSDTRFTGKDKDADLQNSEKERLNEVVLEISQELLRDNVLQVWIEHMDQIGFESSKQIVELCGHVFRANQTGSSPASTFLLTHESLIFFLLNGYEKPDRAIHYGSILREACKHESVARVLLFSNDFYNFFSYVQGTAFDVSSDAFSTFRDLLVRHKEMVSGYLIANYDTFFEHYTKLIKSENYVTQRQALKLLAELLLDRHNFDIMQKYISNAENLKLVMILLASKKKQIAFEAFHVFKNFVANRNKPDDILSILYSNQEKLIDFLTSFQQDRTDDGQLSQEKAYLIKIIKELKPPVSRPPTNHSPSTSS